MTKMKHTIYDQFQLKGIIEIIKISFEKIIEKNKIKRLRTDIKQPTI